MLKIKSWSYPAISTNLESTKYVLSKFIIGILKNFVYVFAINNKNKEANDIFNNNQINIYSTS